MARCGPHTEITHRNKVSEIYLSIFPNIFKSKPALKDFEIVEYLWRAEVQQTPEILQCVLRNKIEEEKKRIKKKRKRE